MRYFWIVFVSVNLLSLSPALAQLYRWTDKAGKVHITDDLSTIPPAYRDRARASATEQPDADGQSSNVPQPPAQPSGAQLPTWAAPPEPNPAVPQARQRVQALEQEIATARQERQTYLEQLRNTRTIHTTPAFVRQRRQIAELGRALVAVEQRLDTLAAALERLQPSLPTQASSPAVQRTQQTGFDAAGYGATYWQKRARTIHAQLHEAASQRRNVLSQLMIITDDETYPAERQGREILQHADALHRIEADIDVAQQAWQALIQEAVQAAIPPEWLQ